MKKILMSLTSVCMMTGLGACSHYDYHSMTSQVYGAHGLIHEKPPAYQLEHEVEGLKLPPDLSQETIQPLYAVPPLSPTKRVDKKAHQDLLLPPASSVAKLALHVDNDVEEVKAVGAAHYYYTHVDGRVLLVLDKPIDEAWQWLGMHLSQAGLTIIQRSAEAHTYQVRGMTNVSGTPGMYTVHMESLASKVKTQIWFSESFFHAGSHLDSGFYFDRLLKQLEAKS